MENSKYSNCFNKQMSSGQALHVYVTLLKQVPKSDYNELREAYFAVDDQIIERDMKLVKAGYMF